MNSIRKYREQAGLTQLQLSDVIGVSRQSVMRFETGATPHWTEISAMCKTLTEKIGREVTPGELMLNPPTIP